MSKNTLINVIKAGIRFLEDEDLKNITLKNAIKTGIESGVATNFDSQHHLLIMKKTKVKNT